MRVFYRSRFTSNGQTSSLLCFDRQQDPDHICFALVPRTGPALVYRLPRAHFTALSPGSSITIATYQALYGFVGLLRRLRTTHAGRQLCAEQPLADSISALINTSTDAAVTNFGSDFAAYPYLGWQAGRHINSLHRPPRSPPA